MTCFLHRLGRCALTFGWLATSCMPSAAGASTPATDRYLAADPSLRMSLENVEVQLQQAQYVAKVLELDQPWEAPFTLSFPGSVVQEPDTGRYRMYYELLLDNTQRFVAMAVSDDGVNWTKPPLNITGTKYTDDPRNNFINHTTATWMRGPAVFVDPNPAAPADERYKFSWRMGTRMYANASADGLNFHTVGTIADNDGALDSPNITFWDPKTESYMAYMRWRFEPDLRRGISRKMSTSWDSWPGERTVMADPHDHFGSRYPDFYTSGVFAYHGQYIAMPTLNFRGGGRTTPSMYPSLMHSRDGVDWHFDDHTQPALDLAAHGQTTDNFGAAFVGSNLIERDGELWLYYSYDEVEHSGNTMDIHLAKFRQDGFAAITTGAGSSGVWTTSLLEVPVEAMALYLNVEVRGGIRVEVLDADLQPVAGLSGTDAMLIGPGDDLHAKANWRGGAAVAQLAGETVAFRFLMEDASIYSFTFVPEPASLGLLAAGAAWCMTRRRPLNPLS